MERFLMSKFLTFMKDEDGASAAEYALILAIVGAAIAAAAIFLGNQIAAAINSAATCISSPTVANC
jgi:pilus assembly protein Flp/PilA